MLTERCGIIELRALCLSHVHEQQSEALCRSSQLLRATEK